MLKARPLGAAEREEEPDSAPRGGHSPSGTQEACGRQVLWSVSGAAPWKSNHLGTQSGPGTDQPHRVPRRAAMTPSPGVRVINRGDYLCVWVSRLHADAD